jgi:hypothetical protein
MARRARTPAWTLALAGSTPRLVVGRALGGGGFVVSDRRRIGIAIQPDWLREGVTRAQVIEGLRPLLELPVELVLPAHGAPTDRAALERALS